MRLSGPALMTSPRLRLVGALALIAAPLLARNAGIRAEPQPGDPEVRALWVTRFSLASPESIRGMVQAARASGFNTLLVQVRARGDAYFSKSLEPRAAALDRQPGTFDPLATVLAAGHGAGLRVHAWVNIGLIASAAELPASRAHIVYRHPEWLMVPRAIAPEMALLDAKSQIYLDKLARWTRGQSADVEGLYLSPIPPEAADYTVAVVGDLAARYNVDGVHLDYARYPNEDFDYGRDALAGFMAAVVPSLADGDARRLERQAAATPFASVDALPDRWREFRQGRLTALVERLAGAVRAWRPTAVVSAAVYPDATEAAGRRLQDWRAWIARGAVDVVCPLAYATDVATFAAQMASARTGAGDRPLWAGIGAYRLTSAQTIQNIEIARRAGANGIVLFSYDSVMSGPNGGEYLAQVGQTAFTR